MPSIMPKGGWDDPSNQPIQRLTPQPQPAQYVYAQQAYAQPSYVACKVCDRGVLFPKGMFRMSAPVVAIGFILLIPSVLGVIFFGMLAFGIGAMGATSHVVSFGQRQQVTANLRRAGVPRPIITAVLVGHYDHVEQWMNSDESGRVTYVEEEAIKQAEMDLTEARATEVGGGFASWGRNLAIAMAIASFVGGLLGWLLVMRKRVLQCAVCGAVINAS